MKIVNDLIQTVFFIPVLIHPYEYSDPVIDTLCPILMKNQRLKYGPKEKPKSNFIPEKPPSIEPTYSSDEVMSVASLKAGYRLW